MRRITTLGLLALTGLQGLALAGQVAPGVNRAVRIARELVRGGKPGRAEALLEALTRTRSDDPRAWYALAELRIGLGAKRGAIYAYHRSAGLASGKRRAKIAARLGALELPPMPPRHRVEDEEEFLALAKGDACRYLARTSRADASLDCDAGLSPVTPAEGYRITPALAKRLATDPRAWVRQQVVAHAPLKVFRGSWLKALVGETESRVREAFLRRLQNAAGELPLDEAVLAAVAPCALDPRFEVRIRAWELLGEAGRSPVLTPGDFRSLVEKADVGRASKDLLRSVFRSQRREMVPVLADVLAGGRHDGKVASIMLLALEGGRSGQMEVALAFTRPGSRLGNYWGHAYQALATATRGSGIELGASPQQWVEALSE